ncbi:MFS transporter [Rhodococcus sp. SGAir0479]|uniref:MFS transporter n=1 Tax=Rhodococcus sp. SGAir0479 TaxID=2567884 RepID=UPI0010CCE8EE|nr:MFS transporter [Rhodococcus sp. SGAir0479]QCQ91410.1 MFS transporter [Rhodococcus sp. SGAir0479]
MRELLRTRGILVALLMGATTFGGWSLLLPVVPKAIADGGGSDAAAGASTAIFMAATVATQLKVPALLRRYGYRAVLALGCVLLGPPSLAFLWSTATGPALAISAVRGVGFGMVTVAGIGLLAELAPRNLLGRVTGANGVAIAAAQMIVLPLGLALYQAGSEAVVFVLGALIPTLSLVSISRLPAVPNPGLPAGRKGLPAAVLLIPCLSMLVASAAYGGMSSLLPIASEGRAAIAGFALSASAGAMLVGRYGAGVVADRIGGGRTLVPALVLVGAGMALVGLSVAGIGGDAALVVGAMAFGAGFGAVQNEALLTLLASAGPDRVGAASAAWNIAYDGGTGVGALALGVVAGALGYPAVFALSAIAALVVAPTALALRGAGPGSR